MELRISSDLHILPSESNDPLSLFGNFPSTVNIKKDFDASFSFRETNSGEVIKIIKTLNISKACQKLNAEKGEIHCVLKHVDVVLIQNKRRKKDKSSFRPLSILTNLSEFIKK